MNKDWKICIYAICKNELKFVDQWFNSMMEADYICVLDTGSTDGTYEKLLEWQKKYPNKIIIDQKVYSPWRFDTPRNDSMLLAPKDTDIFWCTDFDELLVSGWSKQLRAAWKDNSTRGIYLYSWSHTDTGEPAKVFWYDKVHNKDYHWEFPVHETLMYNKNLPERMVKISNDILLHHYQEEKGSRSSYLSLLQLRLQENPKDNYGKMYLMQEYFAQQKYEDCINFIKENLLKNLFEEEDLLFRPASYFFLGACYYMLHDYNKTVTSYKMGIASFPQYRDNYMALVGLYLDNNNYNEAYDTLKEMQENTIRFNSWLERDYSWSYLPYLFFARCFRNFGLLNTAADYALLAYTINPSDEIKIEYEEIKKESQSFKLKAVTGTVE